MNSIRKKISLFAIAFVVCLLALLGVSIYFTFSYFTSTAKRKGTLQTGVLSLDLVDSTGATLSTNALTTQFTNGLLPGDSITINNVYVKNTSNFDVYSIIKLRVEITKVGETSPSLTIEKWMNLSNQEIVIGTTPADELASGARKQGIISIDIPTTLGNEYKQATAKLTYKALAVQKAHIPPMENTENTEAQFAAEYLYEEYIPRNISIKVGNTTTQTLTIDGNTVADVSADGITTDNSCGWYYDAACTRPAYDTDVITNSTQLYTKTATTEKISTSSTTSTTATITGVSGARDEVVIPQTISGKTVTTIAANAFKDNTEITSVVIPEGVKTINANAFSGCSSLETITIPSTCKSIGNKAFYNNTSLRSIMLTNDMVNIGAILSENPFIGASTLAFNQYDKCYYLGTETNGYAITVQATSKLISSCIIHPDCKQIGGGTFASCYSLKSIEMPEGVVKIGSHAFYMTALTSTDFFPSSLQEIGVAAFRDVDSFRSIYIPENVSSIGSQAFNWSTHIETIKVDPYNQYFDSRNNCNALIETSTDALILGCKNTVIPEDINSIGNSAFRGASYVTNRIPNSVTKFGGGAFERDGALTDIILPSSLNSMESGVFSSCTNLTAVYCEATSKPSGWNANWNGSSATVYWYRENDPSGESGNFWHYDTDGVTPVIWE